MATVSVVFGRSNSDLPVMSEARISEAITTSGSNTASTNAATVNDDVVEVAVSGGAVWVTIAAAPVAAAGTTYLLPDGTTRHFAVGSGDKVGVIDN